VEEPAASTTTQPKKDKNIKEEKQGKRKIIKEKDQ